MSNTDDPRLRDIIIKVDQNSLSSFKHDRNKFGIGIIGFPFDEGCTRNGGRAGAKDGPSIFRYHLYKIGCHPNPEWNIKLSDTVVIYVFVAISNKRCI